VEKRIFCFLSGGVGSFIRLVPIMEELKAQGYTLAYSAIDDVTKKMSALGYERIMVPWIASQDQALLFPETTHWYDAADYWGALGYKDKRWIRELWSVYYEQVKAFKPDLIVGDLAIEMNVVSKMLGVPLVAITQSCYHPLVKGGRLRSWQDAPADKPGVIPEVNQVLSEFDLEPIERFEELFVGDVTIIPSFPEFDRLEQGPHETLYVGPILWDGDLDIHIAPSTNLKRPPIFVYTGRIQDHFGELGGLFVLETCLSAFSRIKTPVIISHGGVLVSHQGAADVELLHGHTVSNNIQLVDWMPLYLAYGMSRLVIHHGGHGSCMATFQYGTPSLVVPTQSEREYNARAMENLGTGRMILPCDFNADSLLQVVDDMLSDPTYRERAICWRHEIRRRTYGGARQAAQVIRELA